MFGDFLDAENMSTRDARGPGGGRTGGNRPDAGETVGTQQ